MIRVIIDRMIAETMEANYEDAALDVLQLAVKANGFISGESLKDIRNPRHRIVLCKWRSPADWDRWCASEERKSVMGKLNLMLETEEKISILDLPE